MNVANRSSRLSLPKVAHQTFTKPKIRSIVKLPQKVKIINQPCIHITEASPVRVSRTSDTSSDLQTPIFENYTVTLSSRSVSRLRGSIFAHENRPKLMDRQSTETKTSIPVASVKPYGKYVPRNITKSPEKDSRVHRSGAGIGKENILLAYQRMDTKYAKLPASNIPRPSAVTEIFSRFTVAKKSEHKSNPPDFKSSMKLTNYSPCVKAAKAGVGKPILRYHSKIGSTRICVRADSPKPQPLQPEPRGLIRTPAYRARSNVLAGEMRHVRPMCNTILDRTKEGQVTRVERVADDLEHLPAIRKKFIGKKVRHIFQKVLITQIKNHNHTLAKKCP